MDSMSLLNSVLQKDKMAHPCLSDGAEVCQKGVTSAVSVAHSLLTLESSLNIMIPRDLEDEFNRAVTKGDVTAYMTWAKRIEKKLRDEAAK